MTAVSIAFSHHARTLGAVVAALVVIALTHWVAVPAARWVRDLLCDEPATDIYGQVHTSDHHRLTRGMRP